MIEKVILEYSSDMILQLRAAISCLKDETFKKGDVWGIGFEDGSTYGVKHNGKSVRVYTQNTVTISEPLAR